MFSFWSSRRALLALGLTGLSLGGLPGGGPLVPSVGQVTRMVAGSAAGIFGPLPMGSPAPCPGGVDCSTPAQGHTGFGACTPPRRGGTPACAGHLEDETTVEPLPLGEADPVSHPTPLPPPGRERMLCSAATAETAPRLRSPKPEGQANFSLEQNPPPDSLRYPVSPADAGLGETDVPHERTRGAPPPPRPHTRGNPSRGRGGRPRGP